jgi:hypothetical protein
MNIRLLRSCICSFLLVLVGARATIAQQHVNPTVTRRVQSEKSRDEKLARAVLQALGEKASAQLRYRYNRVDLNGDGKPEVLVYVSAPAFCGTGGCKLLVFESKGDAYALISDITPGRIPLIVTEHRTHGWKDLIVPVSGGGVQSRYYAVLQFDGKYYPDNPTVAPAKRLEARITGVSYLNGSTSAELTVPPRTP